MGIRHDYISQEPSCCSANYAFDGSWNRFIMFDFGICILIPLISLNIQKKQALCLFQGNRLMPKCLYHYYTVNTPQLLSICAFSHLMSVDSSFSDVIKLHVEPGNMPGVVLAIHLQSSCSSPFLGKYIGTITPKHFWMNFILRGKELLHDRQEKEAKYPAKVPRIFQAAPVEDYKKNVCVHLCQNPNDDLWRSNDRHHKYNNTCKLKKQSGTTHLDSSSINDCLNETTFVSFDYSMEHLRMDEANLDETQLKMKQTRQIYISSENRFFTIKNINIEKTFEEYLSEIGGNFGLFAGASILTFVEIGVLVVKVLKGFVLNRRQIWERDTPPQMEGQGGNISLRSFKNLSTNTNCY